MAVERTTDLHHILRFFERPTHPSFTPKGLNRNVFFAVPQSYYPPNYESLATQMENHVENLDEGTIVEMEELPFELDLSKVQMLDRRASFTLFNPLHVACSSALINILMNIETKYLISACSKIQMADVNPYLFEYALSVVLLHREDTRRLRIPSQVTYMPEFYMANSVLTEVSREVAIVQSVPNEGRSFIEIPVTSSVMDPDPESPLAYFREDIGIALHHWHWHLVFPFEIQGEVGIKLVNKDRRGELFYYMHQQLLARYNTERLCNKMNRVRSLNYFHEPMQEGYYPKLGVTYAKHLWAARPANTMLKDLNRESLHNTILEVEQWRDRILDAIHLGRLTKGNEVIPLDEVSGIDILGNVIESSILSPNKAYYGDLHNSGHLLIAYAHDPDNRFSENNVGVMGDTRTALRDPIFYRWHTFIDDIFQEHKKTLPPYTKHQLLFKETKIVDCKVLSAEEESSSSKRINEFFTYTKLDKLNLAHGLDIAQNGPVYVSLPHLQHQDFYYKITIENRGAQKLGTVRIFMAPARDEKNKEFTFNEQRRLFIELDKFLVVLKPRSWTVIRRNSAESSVTIPFQQMFADVDEILSTVSVRAVSETASQDMSSFCGCGWPEHMLVPKGNAQGYSVQLFVMVTDYEGDKVIPSPSLSSVTRPHKTCTSCLKSAPSYCGLQSGKYPDKKPMGFPFDRAAPSNISTIQDFLTPNMKLVDMKITYSEEIVNTDAK